MKKLVSLCVIAILFAVSFSASVFAAEEKTKSLRDICFEKVSSELDLESVRNKMRAKKAKDGNSYYDVYTVYKTFQKSSKHFGVVKALADDVQLSATFAIGYCESEGGDMDAFQKETSTAVYRPSANEQLEVDTKVKLGQWQNALSEFVENYYNVYVVR